MAALDDNLTIEAWSEHLTLQDLGALGELVGAIAVALTLLYVAAQIRQNTRSLRSSTAFAVNQALAEINGRWVSNANGFTDLWLRGCVDLDSLTPLERERFSRQAYDLLNLAVLQFEAEKNEIGDVHIDYIAYLCFLVQSNAGLRQFVVGLGGPFFASEELYYRILGADQKHLDTAPEPE